MVLIVAMEQAYLVALIVFSEVMKVKTLNSEMSKLPDTL